MHSCVVVVHPSERVQLLCIARVCVVNSISLPRMVPTVFVLVYEMTQPGFSFAVQSLHAVVALRDPPHGPATVKTLTVTDGSLYFLAQFSRWLQKHFCFFSPRAFMYLVCAASPLLCEKSILYIFSWLHFFFLNKRTTKTLSSANWHFVMSPRARIPPPG